MCDVKEGIIFIVMYIDVYVLVSFWVVCVYCIVSKKNVIVCIEFGVYFLFNVICGLLVIMFVVEFVWREDFVGGF